MLGNLSVIIPNYNHSQHISECFRRLLLQSILPKEVIIIDDGSIDNSIRVIESELTKFRKIIPQISVLFIKNKGNKGVIYSENLGVKKANQDYIYFLSVDDTIESTFIEKSLKALQAYPEAGLSSCIVRVQSENGQFVNNPIHLPSQKIKYLNPLECRKILLENDYWTGGNSCIYKKKVFLELNGLKKEFYGFCDVYLAMTVVAKFGAVFIPEQLTTFYLNKNSYSGEFYRLEKINELETIYNKMISSFLHNHSDCFSKSLLVSLKNKNQMKLKLIMYKKLFDKANNLFENSKFSLCFFKIIKIFSLLNFLIVISFVYIIHDKNIKNMIRDIFIIKFRQKFSNLKN